MLRRTPKELADQLSLLTHLPWSVEDKDSASSSLLYPKYEDESAGVNQALFIFNINTYDYLTNDNFVLMKFHDAEAFLQRLESPSLGKIYFHLREYLPVLDKHFTATHFCHLFINGILQITCDKQHFKIFGPLFRALPSRYDEVNGKYYVPLRAFGDIEEGDFNKLIAEMRLLYSEYLRKNINNNKILRSEIEYKLAEAIARGNRYMVECMLDNEYFDVIYNKRINTLYKINQYSGLTILMIACYYMNKNQHVDNLEIIKFLIRKGANIDQEMKMGNIPACTVLAYACNSLDPVLCKVLVEGGADLSQAISAGEFKGCRSIDIVVRLGDAKLTQFFIEHDAIFDHLLDGIKAHKLPNAHHLNVVMEVDVRLRAKACEELARLMTVRSDSLKWSATSNNLRCLVIDNGLVNAKTLKTYAEKQGVKVIKTKNSIMILRSDIIKLMSAINKNEALLVEWQQCIPLPKPKVVALHEEAVIPKAIVQPEIVETLEEKRELIDRAICLVKQGTEGRKRFTPEGIVFCFRDDGYSKEYFITCYGKLVEILPGDSVEVERYIVRDATLATYTIAELRAMEVARLGLYAELRQREKAEKLPKEKVIKEQQDQAPVRLKVVSSSAAAQPRGGNKQTYQKKKAKPTKVKPVATTKVAVKRDFSYQPVQPDRDFEGRGLPKPDKMPVCNAIAVASEEVMAIVEQRVIPEVAKEPVLRKRHTAFEGCLMIELQFLISIHEDFDELVKSHAVHEVDVQLLSMNTWLSLLRIFNALYERHKFQRDENKNNQAIAEGDHVAGEIRKILISEILEPGNIERFYDQLMEIGFADVIKSLAAKKSVTSPVSLGTVKLTLFASADSPAAIESTDARVGKIAATLQRFYERYLEDKENMKVIRAMEGCIVKLGELTESITDSSMLSQKTIHFLRKDCRQYRNSISHHAVHDPDNDYHPVSKEDILLTAARAVELFRKEQKVNNRK